MRFPFDRTVGTRKLDYSGNIGNIVGHGMLKYEKFLRFGKQKVISNINKVGLSKAYLMGHADVSVTMNVYTHNSYEKAEESMAKNCNFNSEIAQSKLRIIG